MSIFSETKMCPECEDPTPIGIGETLCGYHALVAENSQMDLALKEIRAVCSDWEDHIIWTQHAMQGICEIMKRLPSKTPQEAPTDPVVPETPKTLEAMMSEYKTVERNHCKHCGNAWWFDMPDKWQCTTCGARFGKMNGTVQGYLPERKKVPTGK
jgi:hypothetical protein